MKLFLLIFFCLSIGCIGEKKYEKPPQALCENLSEIRKCPKDKSLFLPRNYPARAIYVGFSSYRVHLEFLELLIEKVRELAVKPMLNIMIPKLDEYDAYDFFKVYFNKKQYPFINLITVAANDSLWAQDYLEILFDTQTGKSKIVDLPYFGREGEDLPTSVALSCQKEVIIQPEYEKKNLPGNGDYGGNIEPVTSKVLMLGNNISNITYELIQDITTQDIVEIDVDWLETGHVDELITTLPHKKDASDCEQSLLIASPEVALKLIREQSKSSKPYKSSNEPYSNEDHKWKNYDFCFHSAEIDSKKCRAFVEANNMYQKSIDQSLTKLQHSLKKNHNCELKVEKFPQLFIPMKKLEAYGTIFDRAVPMNHNSVNNIFFYPNLILAKQEYEPFHKEVERILKKFSLNIIYTDAEFVHELNGGIHCATNVAYGCTP